MNLSDITSFSPFRTYCIGCRADCVSAFHAATQHSTRRTNSVLLSTPMSQTRDPNKIYLGIVHRGDTRWETSMSLIQEIVNSHRTKYTFHIGPGGGCDIAHARNLQLHDWHEHTDCGRLVWIDGDTRWTDQLERLLTHDVPYIGGLYPLKGFDCRWSWNGWARPSGSRPGLWDVEELCTGFTAMKYEVLETLMGAFRTLSYRIDDMAFAGETGYELCQMGPSRGRRLSEDFTLSQRIRCVGYEVNVDPTILVGHVGAVDLLAMHQTLGSFKAPELRE